MEEEIWKYKLYEDSLIEIPMRKALSYNGRGKDCIDEEIHDFDPYEIATFDTEKEAKKELAKYESDFWFDKDYCYFKRYYLEAQDKDGNIDTFIYTSDGDKPFYIAYYINLKDAIDYNKNLEVAEELEEDIEWKKQNGWSADDLENDIRFLQGIKDDIQDIEERYNRSKKIEEDWKDYWKGLHEKQEADKENESSDDLEL